MSERLLDAKQTAEQLGIGLSTFNRLQSKLKAKGLQVVKVPSPLGGRDMLRFRQQSVDRLIVKAAESEAALC